MQGCCLLGYSCICPFDCLLGFLLANEQQNLENMKIPNNKYFVPFIWATSVVARARKEGKIKSDIAMQKLLSVGLNLLANQLTDCLTDCWTLCAIFFVFIRLCLRWKCVNFAFDRN